jgi:molybdenum cofactor cytidylyltransferase
MEQEIGKATAACIIVAAGESRRMGSWKLMLPYKDETIIASVVRTAAELCNPLLIVTGFRGNEMEHYLGELALPEDVALYTVHNSKWERGMFSSIQCGVHFFSLLHLPDPAVKQRFFITLGDMPRIPSETYQKLLQLSKEREESVIRPLYKGKPAHPVLCRFPVSETILNEPDSSAMRSVLQKEQVFTYQESGNQHFFDVDTPESYALLTGKDRSMKEGGE